MSSNYMQCSICLENDFGTGAVHLLCGHIFHEGCIKRWHSRSHTCPNCRAPIVSSASLLSRYRLSLASEAVAHVTCVLMISLLSWNLLFFRFLTPLHLSLSIVLCHLTLYHCVWWGLGLVFVLSVQSVGTTILLFVRPTPCFLVMHSTLIFVTATAIVWFRCAYQRHRAMRDLVLL